MKVLLVHLKNHAADVLVGEPRPVITFRASESHLTTCSATREELTRD
jgi:hypothetical protein